MSMLILVTCLVCLCGALISEVLYVGKRYNYMVDSHNKLLESASILVSINDELLSEYEEFSSLVQQLLECETQEEADIIRDKIHVLVETGVSRYYE